MKERGGSYPYVLLAVAFVLSRTAYYWAGVRFDARPIRTFFQFIDPELLRHRLIESLYYLHMQPPGFNLYAGVVLKLFPDTYALAFHVLHLLMGLTICCLIYYLMSILGVTRWLAFGLTTLFMISPGVVMFENFMLYEYLLVFFLLVAATALYRFSAKGEALWVFVFFACLLCLLLLRNHFHLAYIACAAAFLLYLVKGRRKEIIAASVVPLAIAGALYFKNWYYFGSFSSSTWLGMNMSTIATHQLTEEEARAFIARGLISPVALIDAGSPIQSYRPYIQMPPKTGIPVLDQEVTSTGATNFNNAVFLQIERYYMHDGLTVLRYYPKAYVRSLQRAWFAYFLPTGDFPFFDLNRPRIWAVDRLFNVVIFGQFKDASNRTELRRIEAGGDKIGLVFYTGIFLLIGLPLLWVWSLWYLFRGVRTKTLDRPSAILIGFMLFNITYVTAVANFLSCFENNRYRFQIDAFFLIMLAVVLEQTRRRLFLKKSDVK